MNHQSKTIEHDVAVERDIEGMMENDHLIISMAYLSIYRPQTTP